MILAMDLITLGIDVLILLLFVVLGVLVARARSFTFEYEAEGDWMREQRRRMLATSTFRRAVDPFVRIVSEQVGKLGPGGHRARIRRLLMLSGNPWGYSAEDIVGYNLLTSVLVALAVFLVLLLGGISSIVWPALAAIATYVLAYTNLRSLADQRRIQIERQIPYFLDLTALTMGAGATFRQSAESIVTSSVHGPLEDEVAVMLTEVKAGTPLVEALGRMAKRTDSEELKAMVQAVRQGEELGTPLVKVFEEQAAMNRFKRSQRGEQIAAKLPNRLAVPTTILMLSVLILLFGPIIVKAVRGELM